MRHAFKPEMILEEHPAYNLWLELTDTNRAPASIDRLTGATNKKSTVYRLNGALDDGGSVIAKRGKTGALAVEKTIYQEILPRLSLENLKFFGVAEDEEKGYAWMFIEEAGGKPYSESEPAERKAASVWLARLHAATARLDYQGALPEIGSSRYLVYLNRARATISENLGNPALAAGNVAVLEKILGQLQTIDKNWIEVSQFCQSFPKCLVHGDFISKNVFVERVGKKLRLKVFDWEAAGWGVAAEDVAGLNLEVYGAAAKAEGFILTLETLKQLEAFGFIFRYVAWIQATSVGLAHPWVEQTMQELGFYRESLEKLIGERGWK